MKPRRAPLKRSAIKRKHRKPSEFKRIYGSESRVLFVKSLPCVACGVVGYSENAHIENGGMGRKADYMKIVPLCSTRPESKGWILGVGVIGCHEVFHRLGRTILEAAGLDLQAEAERTEKLWELQEAAS